MHPFILQAFSFAFGLLHLWWRKECQSLTSVVKTIMTAGRHRGRRPPRCRFQHQRQADSGLCLSFRKKHDSQHSHLSKGKTSKCSRESSWKEALGPDGKMARWFSDSKHASIKKQMWLNYRHRAKPHYVICMFRKLGSFRCHQFATSGLVRVFFLFVFSPVFFTLPTLLSLPFFCSQTVLFLTVFGLSLPMYHQFLVFSLSSLKCIW